MLLRFRPKSTESLAGDKMEIQSILESTKKALGLHREIEDFDPELVMFINSAFAKLQQLGVGPSQGFEISGYDEVWDDFIQHKEMLNDVKVFVYLQVRFVFDPPSIATLNNALSEQLKEVTWRINTKREDAEWVNPYENPPVQLPLF